MTSPVKLGKDSRYFFASIVGFPSSPRNTTRLVAFVESLMPHIDALKKCFTCLIRAALFTLGLPFGSRVQPGNCVQEISQAQKGFD
jgi:hypothetical protein